MPTPNSEPYRITAGETVAWDRSIPGFPASAGNTLKYALQASGKALITLVASASGDDYAIAIAAAVTGDYAPGLYTWTAFVESDAGAVRNIIGRGTLSVLPSPLAAFGATHASRMLGLIECALEDRIPNGLEHTNIDGQELARIPVVDLARLRDKYAAKVLLEQKNLAIALGQRRSCSIGIKFVRPR